jgi:HD domain
MNLTESIESAERMFRQILEDFFVSVYDEKNLFSHGIDHHRRVWYYASELLNIPLRHSNSKPSCSASKLIIACYLHDIGMIIEPGPRHGKHSRKLCMQFLHKNNLNEDEYRDVLDTIEDHDRKDYLSEHCRHDLLTVLSVADDLDAFGFTGIYRYSEIYLTRGISPLQIGYLILENAEKRVEYIDRIFGADNFYVQNHIKRYKILHNFFIQYNIQADSYNFKTDNIEGYCGVIQLFILMIRNKMSIKDFFAEVEIYEDDVIIGSFVKGFKSELSSGRQEDQK